MPGGSPGGPPETGSNISVVDVLEAARLLGMSPTSVRRRIRRGELPAHKVNGKWRVVINDDGMASDSNGAAGDSDDQLAQLEAARQQLEAIREEWLQPLILQISHQSERIGRLSAELAEIERERDELLEERNALRARLRSEAIQRETAREPDYAGVAGLVNRVRSSDQIVIVGIVLVLLLWLVSGLAIVWTFS